MNSLRKYEPIIIFIWGLVVNLLIANGYLLPTQKDMWVNGGLELISAFGSVSLFAVLLHHTLNKHTQNEVTNSIQTLVTSINNSNATGSANIPVTNLKKTTVHVNVP